MISYPLTIDGVQTRVTEEGDGPKVALCIHGVGSRADRFRPTLQPLAEAGYRAVAIDLPGHGFADKGALPLSVPFYAQFSIGVMRALELTNVTVVGTSLGGHIGAYMTRLAEPGEVTQVALIGTLGIVPLAEETRVNISRVILANRSEEDCRGKLNALLHDDSWVTDSWVREESNINNSRGADETFRMLGDYFENRINDDLVLHDVVAARAGVRFGLMWGDQDVIVDVETGRACMKALPKLPMVWIKNTGHAPYWERPQDFVTAMVEMFEGARSGESWV